VSEAGMIAGTAQGKRIKEYCPVTKRIMAVSLIVGGDSDAFR